jgi:hypothetical protein
VFCYSAFKEQDNLTTEGTEWRSRDETRNSKSETRRKQKRKKAKCALERPNPG